MPSGPKRMQALLLCRDAHMLTVMNRALTDLEIETSICLEPMPATQTLEDTHLDLVVIDWDDDLHAIELLDTLRASSRNRNALTLGVVRTREAMQKALSKAMHFVTYVPRNVEETQRALRPVYGLMESKRRGAYRSPVRITATIRTDALRSTRATMVDLSETGASLSSTHPLTIGTVVQLGFTLPTGEMINATGKVCWAGARGPAGVRFSYIPPKERESLNRWLCAAEERAAVKPGLIAAVFNNTRPLTAAAR